LCAAQFFEIKSDGVSGDHIYRSYEAAGHDDVAFSEMLASLGEQISEPHERFDGVPHDI
jgi:hypothetical protein